MGAANAAGAASAGAASAGAASGKEIEQLRVERGWYSGAPRGSEDYLRGPQVL